GQERLPHEHPIQEDAADLLRRLAQGAQLEWRHGADAALEITSSDHARTDAGDHHRVAGSRLREQARVRSPGERCAREEKTGDTDPEAHHAVGVTTPP